MKSSLLSGAFGAITAIMLAVFWQIVVTGPSAAPPKRLVGVNSSTGTANTTTVAKSTAMSPVAIVEAAFSKLMRKAKSSANVTGTLPQGLIPIPNSNPSGGTVNTTVVAKSFAISAAAIVEAAFNMFVPNALSSAKMTSAFPRGQIPTPYSENSGAPSGPGKLAQQDGHSTLGVSAPGHEPTYVKWSKIPPLEKPAKIALEAMRHIPLGTPLDEIKRAADAFGVNYIFMESVAKIESDFDPQERTGSYIGLFQLSEAEFKKYGSGDITNPRDNAVAAAYKFRTEAELFEKATHEKPTIADLYLIHQQGWAGAAEQVSHPKRIAWKSMCATDEGKQKGKRWCKQAIWGNTLPSVKHAAKSVDHLTSGVFVAMWRNRVDDLYAQYAEADTGQATQ